MILSRALLPSSLVLVAVLLFVCPPATAQRVLLRGNVHPLARAEFDRGPAEPETPMERMILVLEPSAAQQQELDALLEAQQDPQSPDYHRWLDPEEFGRRFGAAPRDLERIAAWLEARGFQVEPPPAGRRTLLFSGTAAQVESAFHTEIRRYQVNGASQIANARDPEIPREFALVVRGIASLHDFRTAPLHCVLQPVDWFTPEYTSGSTHYMAPADFATIYDAAPLYAASIDGAGQSIAVAGRSNLKPADIQSFRSRYGLTANTPTVIVNGRDPGVVSNDEQSEATLDVEWAGAVGRGAAVQFVVSASTNASDGVFLSAQYIVNHNLAAVMSVSFGSCEAAFGAAGNALVNALWQQAAAQGITVVVAAGDSGAAGCDAPAESTATGGAAINGLCSTPYSICVGGTQFSDAANPAAYWSTASNTTTGSSALSYIPEAAWNSSGVAGGADLWSSGGGLSKVYAKPAWQTGTGVPSDPWRAVPDVSLNAGTHDGYLIWMNGTMYAAGGTSASTPSFAGLLALVDQKAKARQGSTNSALYSLAAKQAAGGAAVFHDVTSGNNSVPGLAGRNAGIGYDAVTGLGSVDANLLVTHWSDAATAVPGFEISVAPSTVTVAPGAGAGAAVTVTASVSGGFNAPVTLSNATPPKGVTAAWSQTAFAAPGSGSARLTLSAATPGSYTIAIQAQGGSLSQTRSVTLTVAAPCTYAIDPRSVNGTASAASYAVTVTAGTGCAWTASAAVKWITVTSGASGSGNGKVGYTVAANTGSAARSGALTIAGQTLAFTQSAPATFSMKPAAASFPAIGGAGAIALTAVPAGSAWSAAGNASWLTIPNGSSGAGSKNVTYAVAANPSAAARTGLITIAGLAFTVTQLGAPACSYKVSVGPTKTASGGTTGSVAVSAATGCGWTANSSAAWLTISSGAAGTGNGAVTFLAAANTSKSARAATLTVAGYAITVSEGATTNGLTIKIVGQPLSP